MSMKEEIKIKKRKKRKRKPLKERINFHANVVFYSGGQSIYYYTTFRDKNGKIKSIHLGKDAESIKKKLKNKTGIVFADDEINKMMKEARKKITTMKIPFFKITLINK